jgi:hypothetical protein
MVCSTAEADHHDDLGFLLEYDPPGKVCIAARFADLQAFKFVRNAGHFSPCIPLAKRLGFGSLGPPLDWPRRVSLDDIYHVPGAPRHREVSQHTV